uniref:Ornithine cyclodeaminase/mu-crystallin n=1 Tax=uncultured bacterium Contig248 TaxID=1393544 RepID=W0FIC5_9BACT|nr:ornithine cyclodeaminase/mu-crystallin [uncultured bacterium Contig248]
MEFIYLSEEDMIKAGVKDMPRCIDTMEDTFRLLHRGDYRLGGSNNSDHGLRTRFPKESDIKDMPLDAPGRWFTAMPAYLGGRYHCFGIKTYGANQDNAKQGLPRSILMMQLLDVVTGAPLAYMSANILSAMRTGGVSGLFARYFADQNAETVTVIGPGVIGRYSLDAVMAERPGIRHIHVFGRGEKSRAVFREHCSAMGYPMDGYREFSSIDEACRDADVIITASSQPVHFGDYPLIGKNSIKQGACVIVTSAVRIDRMYSDDDSQKCVFVADDKRMYMGNRGIDAAPETEEEKKTVTVKGAVAEWLAAGKNVLNLPEIVEDPGFVRDKDTIYLCASGGIPIEDVSWAYECYQKASRENIGQKLNVWEKSSL